MTQCLRTKIQIVVKIFVKVFTFLFAFNSFYLLRYQNTYVSFGLCFFLFYLSHIIFSLLTKNIGRHWYCSSKIQYKNKKQHSAHQIQRKHKKHRARRHFPDQPKESNLSKIALQDITKTSTAPIDVFYICIRLLKNFSARGSKLLMPTTSFADKK